MTANPAGLIVKRRILLVNLMLILLTLNSCTDLTPRQDRIMSGAEFGAQTGYEICGPILASGGSPLATVMGNIVLQPACVIAGGSIGAAAAAAE